MHSLPDQDLSPTPLDDEQLEAVAGGTATPDVGWGTSPLKAPVKFH